MRKGEREIQREIQQLQLEEKKTIAEIKARMQELARPVTQCDTTAWFQFAMRRQQQRLETNK